MRRRRAGVADAATPAGPAAAGSPTADALSALQPAPVVPAGGETSQPVRMPVPQHAPQILAESAPTESAVRPTRSPARPARKESAAKSPAAPVAGDPMRALPAAPPATADPRSRSPLDGFANPFQ
jgi:hypothetical protein